MKLKKIISVCGIFFQILLGIVMSGIFILFGFYLAIGFIAEKSYYGKYFCFFLSGGALITFLSLGIVIIAYPFVIKPINELLGKMTKKSKKKEVAKVIPFGNNKTMRRN